MASTQKTETKSRRFRELSDKELNEITSAFGDRVRQQSLEQKDKINKDLRKAIESARTKFSSHDKKRG